MNNKTKDAWRVVLGGVAATIAIICAIFDFMAMKSLLSSWTVPVLCVLPIAVLLVFPLRGVARWLTDSDKSWLNSLVAFVLIYPLLLLVFVVANRRTADPQPGDVPAVVDRVYKQTRYKTRRISRRVYGRGAPYKVNRVDVTLIDGPSLSFDVSKKIYNTVSKGDTIDIPAAKGFFNLVWLDQSSVKARHPREKKKKGEFRPRVGHSYSDVAERHRQRIDSLRRKFNHNDD